MSNLPTDRNHREWVIYALAVLQMSCVVILIWFALYSVRRWEQFDEAVEINSRNIQKINESLNDVGIKPDVKPVKSNKL